MADKKEKVHINIDEIENGFEVGVWFEKPMTLSQRKGWVPTSYGPTKKYSFPTLEKSLAHIKEECGKKEGK